jgi:GTP cyclohydrolase I
VSRNVPWDEIYERLSEAPPGKLYGIPRGGAIVAGLTGRAVDDLAAADCIVDDVTFTGNTRASIQRMTGKPMWALFEGVPDGDLIFPWDSDRRASREEKLIRLGTELIRTLGYDPMSPDLRDTPARWARWWEEFFGYRSERFDTSFAVGAYGQMVMLTGIRLWSVCEHHLLPFHLRVAVGYVVGERVLGLSKFVRSANKIARRLQVQERIVEELAAELRRVCQTSDVAVLASGRHTCLEARGVRMPATTTSMSTSGAFQRDRTLRSDFLVLAHRELAATAAPPTDDSD